MDVADEIRRASSRRGSRNISRPSDREEIKYARRILIRVTRRCGDLVRIRRCSIRSIERTIPGARRAGGSKPPSRTRHGDQRNASRERLRTFGGGPAVGGSRRASARFPWQADRRCGCGMRLGGGRGSSRARRLKGKERFASNAERRTALREPCRCSSSGRLPRCKPAPGGPVVERGLRTSHRS